MYEEYGIVNTYNEVIIKRPDGITVTGCFKNGRLVATSFHPYTKGMKT